MDDGSTDGSSELILLERRRRALQKEVPRVEHLVAQKFERRSVKRVGSRLGGDDHLAAGAVSILGGIHAGQDVEFLNRVDGRAEIGSEHVGIIVVEAVQQEVIAGLVIPGDVESTAKTERGVLRRGHDIRCQLRQRPHLPAVERHLDYLLVVDYRAHFAGFRIHAFRVGGDRDIFRYIADFHIGVHANVLGHPDHQVSFDLSLESAGGEFQVVSAGRQETELIDTGGIGLGRADRPLLVIGQLDRRVRQHGAGAVLYGAGDRAFILRPG